MCSDAYSFKEKEIFVIKNFVNKKLPLKIVKVEVFCCQYLHTFGILNSKIIRQGISRKLLLLRSLHLDPVHR